MAEVFLAAAEGISRFNKLVVIKRLLWEDEPLRQMLLDEARIAAMLNHPNVVDTYEGGVHGGSHFIAMEYLEGQPLNHIISRARDAGRTLDPAMCVRIVVDALLGLHYAHELRDYDGTPLSVVPLTAAVPASAP